MKTAYESTMIGQPFTTFNKSVYEWYLFSQGLYWRHLISHVLVEEKTDEYGEFLIHHLATIALVFGSTVSNQIGIGAIISFLHIVTDVPIPMAKFFASTKFETLAAVFMIVVQMPNWFYWRLVCFPYWVYHIPTNHLTTYQVDDLKQHSPWIMLYVPYLCVLVLLHYYWFYLMCCIIYNAIAHNKYSDSHYEKVKSEKSE